MSPTYIKENHYVNPPPEPKKKNPPHMHRQIENWESNANAKWKSLRRIISHNKRGSPKWWLLLIKGVLRNADQGDAENVYTVMLIKGGGDVEHFWS